MNNTWLLLVVVTVCVACVHAKSLEERVRALEEEREVNVACQGKCFDEYDTCRTPCDDADEACLHGCVGQYMECYGVCVFGGSKRTLQQDSTKQLLARLLEALVQDK